MHDVLPEMRSKRYSRYFGQDNKTTPFVLDCSTAGSYVETHSEDIDDNIRLDERSPKLFFRQTFFNKNEQ